MPVQSGIDEGADEPLCPELILVTTKRPRPEPASADEAEHERSDHRWNLELAVAFDYADCLGVVFQRRRWKERSEPLFNSARGGFVGHTELLLTPFMYRLRFQS